MRQTVQWVAPAPFWGDAPDLDESSRVALRRPGILRFATDSFMDEFNRVLETDPAKLCDLEVQAETWKTPLGSAPAVPPPPRLQTPLQRRLEWLKTAAKRRADAATAVASRLSKASATAVLEPPAEEKPAEPPEEAVKLYQPAHQRFYLVTAGLVCRRPGLPDRAVDAAAQERIGFVLRRVVDETDEKTRETTRCEYGFVPAGGNGGAWRKIDDPERQTADAEERLPLFAVNFQDASGRRRRVLAGLVPAGRRETYVGASKLETPAQRKAGTAPVAGGDLDPGAPPPPVDPRIALLSAEVIEPWKTLVQRAARDKALYYEKSPLDERSDDDRRPEQAQILTASRENIQTASWYLLLDFATFLQNQAKEVWAGLTGAPSPRPTPDRQDAVDKALAAIAGTVLPPAVVTQLRQGQPAIEVKTNLKDALIAIAGNKDIEGVEEPFVRANPARGWPAFLFPLADVSGSTVPNLRVDLSQLPANASALAPDLRRISALRDLVAAALPPAPTAAVPDLPLAAQPVMAPDVRALFVIRCVFDRPGCAPVAPTILSAPSRRFELAGFFDPEAPARPIRIALPVDTSPAGLRRAPKNTAFMVSDMLCGQIARAKGLGLIDLVRSVLPFPLHKDLEGGGPAPCKTDAGLSLGMICSLSIPIITICALILLMIMVSILDIIFRWLPYFIFCFPLPNFSAKPKEQP